MYIYIYIYIYNIIYLYNHLSPNRRSLRGPGGVGERLDSPTAPKSVHENLPLWSSVASRGLQLPPVASRCLQRAVVVSCGVSWSPVAFSLAFRFCSGFSIRSLWLQEFPLCPFVIVIHQLCLGSPAGILYRSLEEKGS